jgi:hypothetical protein
MTGMPAPGADPARLLREAQSAIESFLKSARKPALLEPGEDLLALEAGCYAIEFRNGRLTIQAWNEKRNLVRKITAVRSERPGKLELEVERFARRQGTLLLLDTARPSTCDWERRGARLVFRERFRQLLARQFLGWKVRELSTEADLEHTLSPAYARALVVRGQSGWAAMGAAPGSESSDCLTFGLIWLDYLRQRERRLTIEGLALFLPRGSERAAGLRMAFLNSGAARFDLYAYSEEDYAARLDPADRGNLETTLDVARQPGCGVRGWADRLAAIPGVEQIRKTDGTLSLRVLGLEFASAKDSELRFGIDTRTLAREHNLAEIERLAAEIRRFRSPAAADRRNPIYLQNPEAWLESRVRAALGQLDASLLPAPVYGQVPAMAGGERGVIDLLACDRDGRLAVLELKAAPDVHLPMQALDYWMRVTWHAERGEFAARGYFPGIELRGECPRLLLVAPALEFHPTTEKILRYFAPSVPVERIGLGVEWRSRLEVMFRLRGAESPD